ncbi:MAG: hypothetical protein J7M14_07715 [Planctomycetes bacterium]|nr:hypothetical protein [Planctomycetota bacterium]
MAILTPSALVESITGRISGDVLETWRGINYIRNGPFPRQARVKLQQSLRGLVNTYAGKWDSLTSGQKAGWNYYANGLPAEQSGFNSYVANNLKLLYAAYSTLVEQSTAPAWPSAPNAPVGFALAYHASSDVWNASWSSPSDPILYVQCFRSVQTGRNEGVFPTWTFVETASSLFSPIAVDASPFPAGTVLRARIRTIDEQGEVSSFSTIEEATKL